MSKEIYDIIIIGAGPSGLTASIYASNFYLKHILIAKDLGGQMRNAPDILNYPGFLNVSGQELTNKMVEQVKVRGGELITQSVIKISKTQLSISKNEKSEGYEVETMDGKKYTTRAIILASGTERRKLGVKGETEYTGKGVRYCANCERQEFEGKICVVIGGGNSALQAVVQLSNAAKKIYLIYRGNILRGDQIWIEQIKSNNKVEVLYETVIEEIIGDGKRITGVNINSTNKQDDSRKKTIGTDLVFIEIGGVPGTALVVPLGIKLNERGYIDVNEKLETNISGIFATGDLVSYGLSIEQISSAVGLGARSAASAFAYLKKEKAPSVWGKAQIKR